MKGFNMLLNEDQIVELEIDLEELKKNKLDESFLSMFGSALKLLMGYMFGPPQPLSRRHRVKGRREDVESLARTLGREKRYLEALKKHGLDDPKTFKSKASLDKAIKGFEKGTGLKWPFK